MCGKPATMSCNAGCLAKQRSSGVGVNVHTSPRSSHLAPLSFYLQLVLAFAMVWQLVGKNGPARLGSELLSPSRNTFG